ncbi:TonB-dependent receptor [Marinirhabdus gelatinilytica]|uniref:Outer membrane receptor protein involved in Fe transport n=1 Tax=Marinirhabdus gelatinilytica TaxID=1703343 RepID=A0A370QIY0_9FLAO|nr:TonB-dependent receptor [Marinirhabdus gelatinilytica]RDK88302.1 outer membrane receptor protein involved in Fe transport [Marinirhabdus gelatinilytica]
MKNFPLLLLSIFFFQATFGQTGVTGTINDGEFNDVLPFANILVKDTQKGTTSDFEGKYTLELEPGTYTLVYSFVGYQTKEITDIVVTEGQLTSTNVTLSASTGQLDEVVITTTARQNTEAAVLSFQKNSVNLLDGLSLETIKKTGASDIATAVKNVPGVSVQGGKFVYVRGLGDRYTKSILNGVDVPGLDPDRNTLQLDIFPTQILENVIVIKAATADQPADFTGGVIDIVTKDIPTREEYSLSVGATYNSDFHFKDDYLASEKSQTDFLGFDDGLRDNPLASNQVVPLPQENGEIVELITQRFEERLAAQRENSFMDFNFSATAGNQYDIGENKFGYLASLSYRNETTYYDEYIDGQIFRKDEADKSNFDLLADRTQNGELGSNNVLVSALAGLSLKSEKSKYRFNVLHVQNGESQASIFRQSNFIISSNNIKKDNLIYTQRSITNGLLSGKHSLGEESDWTVEWSLSPTLARIEDKDFRVTPFRITTDPDTGEETFTIEPSESGIPSRFYRDLEEISLAGKLDIEKKHSLFGFDAKAKFGGAYTFKNRTFEVLKFSIPSLNFPSATLNGNPDLLLADENVYDPDTNSGFYIRQDSNDSDSFDSDMSIAAGYVSEEFKVTDWLNSIVGVRFEQFTLNYTGERQDGSSLDNAEILNTPDFFPSVNLIFDLNEDGDKKIRTSYSRTTARPSFKEASLAEIFDPISSTTFIGNIDLQPTYINNFDLRFEKYGESGDFFALSGFYKSFKDPIELSFIRRAYGQFTPLNLGDATVFGGEIEVRKNLGFIRGLDNMNFNVNFSLIESQQEYSEDEREGRLDNLREGETLDDTRQLQGQSPFLINLGLNYEDEGWNAGLFYNSQGKTLQIVGAGDVGDVFTLPFHNVKLNLSKSFGENNNSTISLKFENLLDDDIESVYQSFGTEDELYSRWNPGQDISLSYSVRF